jgi:putative hydrolase of the HAD superfamily
MTIKAFIFDCNGVLLREGDLSPYTDWELRLGLEPGRLATCLWGSETCKLAEVGKLTDAEYWRAVAAEVGVSAPDDVEALHDSIGQTWVLDEQVLALVDRLRARYRIAMLSNATDGLEALLTTRFQVADRFEVLGNSARLGVAKPDPAAFRAVLSQLGLKPEEVVFVDDRAANISAAAALGMHVIWYVNARELERQLGVYLGSPLARNGAAVAAPRETATDDKD